MALSNWDTLAVDHNGVPTTGVYVSPSGVRVEIYKNFLYVSDEHAWQESDGYARPTIMEINHCELRYRDTHIIAMRGPKDGVYCLVYCKKYAYGDQEGHFSGMVGIGCYGFDLDTDDTWLGVEQAEIDYLKEHIIGREEIEAISIPVGHGEKSFELKSWTTDCPDEMRGITLDGAMRFNQGDAFFAAAFGRDIPATDPGDADVPLIMEMLGHDNDQDDDAAA